MALLVWAGNVGVPVAGEQRLHFLTPLSLEPSPRFEAFNLQHITKLLSPALLPDTAGCSELSALKGFTHCVEASSRWTDLTSRTVL